MSYTAPPGGQRPDASRYYSPQIGGAGGAPPSFTPSFTPANYMSPTVAPPPTANYQSPPPPLAAQIVRQPSFVPDAKAAPKGHAVDFSFDPRAGSAVPQHVMQPSRSSSGGFPAAPQHAPSFAPPYPAQVVTPQTPQQYSSAPMQAPPLTRQPTLTQTPNYPPSTLNRSSTNPVMTAPTSPSALPLPQTPTSPSGSAIYTPPPPSTISTPAPSFSSPSQPTAAPIYSPPPPGATGPAMAMPTVAPTSPPYVAAAPPSADLVRQLAETTERAKQAEENAVRFKAQLDESHKQFQELVSKQSKLELSSQTFTEQQKKYEDEIKQLTDKLRVAEEKSGGLARQNGETEVQLKTLAEKVALIEKHSAAAEGRARIAEEKLAASEDRARRAEEQFAVLSSAQSAGNSTLAQQIAMRDALEAALKEANDRLSKADGIWQAQNQRIAALEAELQQWRHQGPAKDLELQAALTREKTLKEALEQSRKQASDSAALVTTRTQEALLQLEQRNAELAAAHQREAELKRLLEQRGPDSGSSTKIMELQAKLDAKTAELDTAARREQAFREALEKAKKNLTDADAARAVLEDDLAKAEENVRFFQAIAKNNEALAAAAESKLENAIAAHNGQPFAPAEAPSPASILDNIRARLAALNTSSGDVNSNPDSTAEALAELDGL